jgi:hypothetical protein
MVAFAQEIPFCRLVWVGFRANMATAREKVTNMVRG